MSHSNAAGMKSFTGRKQFYIYSFESFHIVVHECLTLLLLALKIIFLNRISMSMGFKEAEHRRSSFRSVIDCDVQDLCRQEIYCLGKCSRLHSCQHFGPDQREE